MIIIYQNKCKFPNKLNKFKIRQTHKNSQIIPNKIKFKLQTNKKKVEIEEAGKLKMHKI